MGGVIQTVAAELPLEWTAVDHGLMMLSQVLYCTRSRVICLEYLLARSASLTVTHIL